MQLSNTTRKNVRVRMSERMFHVVFEPCTIVLFTQQNMISTVNTDGCESPPVQIPALFAKLLLLLLKK